MFNINNMYILLLLILFSLHLYNLSCIKIFHKPKKYKYKRIKTNILTFNIQKFPLMRKNYNEIKNLINQYSIILLQECFNDTNLEKSFPNYYIIKDNLKGINFLTSGLAIMSKFPIIKYETYKFKNTNRCTFDQFSEKGFLVCWIKIKNKKVCIINTHLQSSSYSEYDKIACLQFNEILNYIQKLKNMYILGGDFNIDIKNMKSMYKLKYKYPRKPTIYMLNGHSSSKYIHNYNKFIFDYFITNKYKILKNIKTIRHNYSDHNPVAGKIELN